MNSLQREELQFVETFFEDEESAKQMFKISDLESLNWTFRKMAALKEKEKEIKALAQKEKDRIEYWERQELSGINQSLDFFHNLVYEFHAAVLRENPKAKTLSTPYGKTKARTAKEQPEKENEEAILQHVIENGMDDYIKNSLKWDDFKKAVKIVEISGEKLVVDENGAIVPGMTVKPETVSYSVEV